MADEEIVYPDGYGKCPECEAKAGKPCQTAKGNDSSKPHAERPEKGRRQAKPKTGPIRDLIGVHVPVKDNECGCGCGSDIGKRKVGFLTGHDAKLKSKLMDLGVLERAEPKPKAKKAKAEEAEADAA